MKKNILYIVFAIIMMVGMVDVYAEDTCSLETKTKLRVDASNLTVNYEPVEKPVQVDPSEPEDSHGVFEYYFDMKVYNLNSQLKVKVIDVSQNDLSYDFTYKNMGLDGAVTIRRRVSNKIANIRFEVYGSDSSGCSSVLLRTIKLTLPKYNNLAEREVCDDVPEFYMCQKYIVYDINVSNFKTELDEYKAKQENIDSFDVDNNSLTNKVANVVSNNKFILVGVVIAAGIAITVYVLNKNRRVM